MYQQFSGVPSTRRDRLFGRMGDFEMRDGSSACCVFELFSMAQNQLVNGFTKTFEKLFALDEICAELSERFPRSLPRW